MHGLAVIGAQWGDEGKGKIVDYLAAEAAVVVRYSGGNNAGHTVVVGDRTLKLHLIPSGILHEHMLCVIGNGTVVDLEVLADEQDRLAAQGVAADNLRISARAHVLMPYHRDLDRLEEEARGPHRLGTTGRGVGPAYVDKVAREGIRCATWPTLRGCGSGWRWSCRGSRRCCRSCTAIRATRWTRCSSIACATPIAWCRAW